MKRFLLIILMGLFMVSFSMPCEAKKKQTNGKVQREKKDDIDKCEEESMNPPAGEFRAYGSAVDDDRDFARHQAVLSAKAALADNLETMVMDVMRKYRAQIKSADKKWNEADVKQDIQSMSGMLLENCRVVCSERYKMSDGSYECSVCVSIPSKMTETLAGATALNDDERMGVEFHEEQFRQSYKDEYEAFRRQQQELQQ
ncbi:MAG: hypothetical protein K2J58_07670 [Muribaculaceae bacterium]|nr:hypothetical protein [Muribaculaceae bacterium]